MDERQQKHSTINDLTDNLSSAVMGLENLVVKVDSDDVPKDEVEKKERKEVSLSEFLSEYPKRIEALNERITVATNQLRDLLF